MHVAMLRESTSGNPSRYALAVLVLHKDEPAGRLAFLHSFVKDMDKLIKGKQPVEPGAPAGRRWAHNTGGGGEAARVQLTRAAALPPNISVLCRYLIIRDFGIDWRHVKLAARNEQLFKNMLNQFETDKSLLFRITGYSDCGGFEKNNLPLRKGRVRNVFKLLGPSARTRVMAMTAAPAQTFLTDNSTIAARANNRAVVIEFFVNATQTI